MRDASSENDRGPLPANGSDGPQGRVETPQTTANLAELAQLLAASIAQNQAGRGGAGGMPTNAELTNLAKLVTAAAGQRTLAPVFKDGLSALSYAQPRPAPQSATASGLEFGHDDEPMPIPSTWRQPAAHDEEPWFRQQLGAAALGLVAGLLIVVPTVLWLSGWFEPSKGKPMPMVRAADTAPEARGSADAAEIKTVRVQVRPVDKPAESPVVTGSVEPRPPASVVARASVEPPPPTAGSAWLVEPKARVDELLAQAAQRVEAGDIPGARELLTGADDGVQGSVSFALAETYDPNMLAAWGSRGVAADVARARALYSKAMRLGAPRAQARLDALR